MLPRMTDAEINLLTYSFSRKKAVVEFGCGGSTVLCAQQGVSDIISVESDRNWIQAVAAQEVVQQKLASGGMHFIHADIGPTGEWGYPVNTDSIARWRTYWTAPWQLPVSQQVDCVFVDGRFRVACTLFALTKVRRDACVIIHDFWSRPEYHVVLKYLTCVAAVDDIGTFSIKPEIDLSALFDDLLTYAFNPS